MTHTVPPVPPLFLLSVIQHRLHLPRPDFRRLAKEVNHLLNAAPEHALVLEPREERRRPVACSVDDHRAVVALGERQCGDLHVLLRGRVPHGLVAEDAVVRRDLQRVGVQRVVEAVELWLLEEIATGEGDERSLVHVEAAREFDRPDEGGRRLEVEVLRVAAVIVWVLVVVRRRADMRVQEA